MTTTSLPRLFGEPFTTTPDTVYQVLRQAGPVAWAEIDAGVHAMVVTSHAAASELLNNTTAFTRDTSAWRDLAEGRVPPDSTVMGILAPRDGILHTDGDRHSHFATPIIDCMARVPHHRLDAVTAAVTSRLLDAFTPKGHADLVTEYALQIPLLVFADLLGCQPDTSRRMADACQLIVSGGPQAAHGAALFTSELAHLVAQKQTEPGDDIATWMLRHPNRLTPAEVVDNLYSLVGASNVPTASWITQALQLLLSDDTYAGDLISGSVAIDRAMQKVLWDTAPVANFTFHVARHNTRLHSVDIPAGALVLISHHACNTDPALAGVGYDSRAHLAFGGGEHRCPVPAHAAVITHAAITALLDRIPDAHLTGPEPPRAPGLFHQCPRHLNITFTREPTPTRGDTP
ncbi:cytochrome P450 [Phytomonospora endophytica]|uniref:Cytochrome P450 n=1 Tax=Phytomonospora endophytica TaxID=714109 RepID=A0A841FW11_9ACTN|nr:cytochrome P450 [Phytomonospora endophytica]MBB6037722.1 cytochrome P450 [Phytomonospora endophytica]GIG67750.1 cytochrome P450 [Phytomonospora endophytica]